MSTKLITGYSGERSITPDDDAQFFNALLGGGDGNFILPAEGRMKADLESNNLVSIASGYASIQGRIVRHYADTYNVDTCASGYKRIDLVVLRYNKDDGGIESADVMVLKGDEVEGEATKPEINEGSIQEGATSADMVLYAINLDGSSVTVSQEVPVWDGYNTIGKYYTASGQTDIYMETWKTICTVKVNDPGVYFITGAARIAKSLNEVQTTQLANIKSGSAITPLSSVRTSLNSGGGVTINALVSLEAGGSIDLQSYGRDGASPWYGWIAAVKIAN